MSEGKSTNNSTVLAGKRKRETRGDTPTNVSEGQPAEQSVVISRVPCRRSQLFLQRRIKGQIHLKQTRGPLQRSFTCLPLVWSVSYAFRLSAQSISPSGPSGKELGPQMSARPHVSCISFYVSFCLAFPCRQPSINLPFLTVGLDTDISVSLCLVSISSLASFPRNFPSGFVRLCLPPSPFWFSLYACCDCQQ